MKKIGLSVGRPSPGAKYQEKIVKPYSIYWGKNIAHTKEDDDRINIFKQLIPGRINLKFAQFVLKVRMLKAQV